VGVLDRILARESATTVSAAVARATAAEAQVEVLSESLADLELALEDEGWERLTTAATQQMSRTGLGKAARVARVMAVANPLIKRGLGVRQAYVWGQGVQVAARATGNDQGEQDVNAVVQAFLDAPGNRAALTGDQACQENERALGTDGNVFIACFTSPLTGFVQARTIAFDEMVDVLTNPEDRDDPWLYLRQWTERTITATGAIESGMRQAFYPALTYRPPTRAKTINGVEVRWDSPVYHLCVNRLDGWSFGIGDAYASLTWARAYRDFLADWVVLVKSLSQFAWRASSKGSKAQRMRQTLARRPATTTPTPGNENTVGATVTLGADATLEAIPKTGATIDSESGKPLAAMVAAGLEVPVTVLLSDPGQTGARAVAETLDEPLRLAMEQRRALWGEAYRAILDYVILQAVKAPQGPLKGSLGRDAYTGRETLTLTGDTDPTVEVTWPSLKDDVPVDKLVAAIKTADDTGKLPPLEVAKLLLHALGVEDVDDLLADMVDDQGRWIDPVITAGQAAVDAFRRGQDPAQVL